MKIVTHYDPKPIPLRCFDWSAIDDDTYDADLVDGSWIALGPCGFGETEAEAIADLKEQLGTRNGG